MSKAEENFSWSEASKNQNGALIQNNIPRIKLLIIIFPKRSKLKLKSSRVNDWKKEENQNGALIQKYFS